jgi:hypothetical protein
LCLSHYNVSRNCLLRAVCLSIPHDLNLQAAGIEAHPAFYALSPRARVAGSESGFPAQRDLPRPQVSFGEFDGRRDKRVLVKVIGE